MQIKNNVVLMETTNRAGGMLEQGGVCGRVIAYPLAGVIQATGLEVEDLEYADEDDQAPSYPEGVTIAHACALELTGRVVRRGITIR